MTGQAFSQSKKPNHDISHETKVKVGKFNATSGSPGSFGYDKKSKKRNSSISSKKFSLDDSNSLQTKRMIKPCMEVKLKEIN